MPAQSHSKVADLVGQISDILESGERNELELKRIAREVRQMKAIAPADTHQLLGMLASLEGDEPEMRQRFQTAHRLDPTNVEIMTNYVTGLSQFALEQDARQWAEKAHQLAPGDVAILDKVIAGSWRCGRFVETVNLLDQRRTLNPSSQYAAEPVIRQCASLLTNAGVRETETEAYLALAALVANQSKMSRFDYETCVLEDEESEWVSGRLLVSRGVAETMQLNDGLADSLAISNVPPEVVSTFTLMFIPAPANGDHAA